MKLFVDDERTAPAGPEWITVRNATDAIRLLNAFSFEEVSLDHDLGPKEAGNGYEVICYIEENVHDFYWRMPKIKIHTANPSARVKMELALESINRWAAAMQESIKRKLHGAP
jgi:hypothetical protein